MHKRILIMVLALSFTLVSIGTAFALGGGNGRKGKYLFRKNCRSCHSEKGAAKDMSPISKLQKEWTVAFTDTSKLPCAGDWKKMSDKDLNDIYTYMHDHAKDSPSPAKCK